MSLWRLEVEEGEVEKRLNRFVVLCRSGGRTIYLHLRNTGRLLDLLYPGARVLYLPKKRGRTSGLIVGVVVDERSAALIDPGTQARAFEEAATLGFIPWMRERRIIGREFLYEGRRIDYLFEGEGRRGLLELKSAVFYSGDGHCMYPDTVSLRGRRHVEALMRARESGMDAVIVFISAHPSCRAFRPCSEVDPAIASLISRAAEMGVEVHSVKMHLGIGGEILLDAPSLPVDLR